jgi:3'-5' exoribonuclease
VSEYNGNLDISVNAYEGVVEPTIDFNLADMVTTSNREIKIMVGELFGFIDQIQDPFLNQLCNKFFDSPKNLKLFSESPAAMMRHQNYVGGLIEHTLNLIAICVHYATVHAEADDSTLDKSLLIAGCIFHDVGKIYEFETSTSIDISREGMLLGHIPIGIMTVNDLIKEIPDFPEILRLKLLHIILSHHGKLEYGSLKEPQFPEAELIHYVDQVDSKVDYMLRQKEEANTDDPWIWNGKERRHVYLE